jgi:hypothetical protein
LERVIRRIAILTISLVALQAGAEGENTYDQRMLDVLREQGAITDSQYEELSKEAAGETAQAQPASAEKDDSEAWKAYWKNGFRVERNDGLFKLKFGGRVYIDGAVISSSDSLRTSAAAEPGSTFAPPDSSSREASTSTASSRSSTTSPARTPTSRTSGSASRSCPAWARCGSGTSRRPSPSRS